MENGWKKFLSDYILVQAETTLSIGIIGTIFARDIKVSLSYFFIPAILGLFYMLPCLVLYFKDDLKVWQIVLQRFIEWIMIEVGTMYTMKILFGEVISKAVYIAAFISVSVFMILTTVISDLLEKKELNDLNTKLKNIREKEELK